MGVFCHWLAQKLLRLVFFFSSRRRHTRLQGDWSSDVCSSDLNWPGDVEGLQGPALMERMRRHAERFATEIVNDHVQAVDLGVRPFRPTGDAGSYRCGAMLIPTRPTARYPGLPPAEAFRGTPRREQPIA